jgi:hypothetical protein
MLCWYDQELGKRTRSLSIFASSHGVACYHRVFSYAQMRSCVR